MDPSWKHPFTSIIAGPTGSGKTYFVERFITNINQMMTPSPQEIIWCYGEWQLCYEKLRERGVIFHEGLPNISEWIGGKRRLVIFDDLMIEADERILSLFVKGSHHRDISVLYLVQNLFGKNKIQRTLSLNSHYIVVFKNPRDKAQILCLGRQMYPNQNRYVSEAFKNATESAHGYLLFDLKQSTPDELRLRTNIFPGEEHTVYIPKKD